MNTEEKNEVTPQVENQTISNETVISEQEINSSNEAKIIDTSSDFDEEPNEPKFITAGAAALGTSIIGAALWAFITVLTGYQIGYMAIAIGFLVGYAVKFTGKGNHIALGIIGASFSLLGCILGNYLSIIGFTAKELHVGFFDAMTMFNPGIILDAMKENFQVMDLVFYGIAVYEGFKFSLFLK